MGHQLHVQQHTLQHILEQRDILTIHYQGIELQVVQQIVRHMVVYPIRQRPGVDTPLRAGLRQVQAPVLPGQVVHKGLQAVELIMQYGRQMTERGHRIQP